MLDSNGNACEEELVFDKPVLLTNKPTHYCPGCHHGIAHKLIAEVIHEMGIAEKTIGVASIGCSSFIYEYIAVDWVEAPHGRAGAVATGLKRAHPDKIVFTYQGDGDLGAIGLCETVHTANRGENITVFFINNTVYGMTGGQMGPTTLVGQKTTTTPNGRLASVDGSPLKIAEMLAMLESVQFATRCSLDSMKNIVATKRAIRKGLALQVDGGGYSLIEMLGGCATNWRMDACSANRFIAESMIPVFPLGVYKDTTKV